MDIISMLVINLLAYNMTYQSYNCLYALPYLLIHKMHLSEYITINLEKKLPIFHLKISEKNFSQNNN